MDKTTKTLAEFVYQTDFSKLTEESIHQGKRRLIDSIACAAAAYQEPFCSRLRSISESYSGVPAARVWGSGKTTSIEMAAFVNGSMIRYLDYSDTFIGKSAGHPSDMLGALVALGEGFEADGKTLITAIVLAYEVYCGLCASVSLKNNSIDQAVCAAVGTSAGAGKLLRLSRKQIEHAISLALAPNLHLYNVRCGALSDWKSCAGPNGARNGVFAALLAQKDITGPSDIIDGNGGFFEATTPFEWRKSSIETPLILSTHLKYYPVCYHGQTAVDAAVHLHDKVIESSIDEIIVETYEAAYRAMGSDKERWSPTTRETADHSLPYTISVTLLEGHLTSEHYTEKWLKNERIKRLIDKVQVKSSQNMTEEYPERIQTRITINNTDGSSLTYLQDLPKGHANNPLSDTEVEEKFMRFFHLFGSKVPAKRAIDLLWKTEGLSNISEIIDTTCQKPSHNSG
ncbi:MmgE/PrpD family protein [Halomonas sp. HK25]|uniref:MmgE/PrpD family protein n=1 Tax=Halomonas sp. HK25 TaxID=3394321 RepID=UPI0039FD5AA9